MARWRARSRALSRCRMMRWLSRAAPRGGDEPLGVELTRSQHAPGASAQCAQGQILVLPGHEHHQRQQRRRESDLGDEREAGLVLLRELEQQGVGAVLLGTGQGVGDVVGTLELEVHGPDRVQTLPQEGGALAGAYEDDLNA